MRLRRKTELLVVASTCLAAMNFKLAFAQSTPMMSPPGAVGNVENESDHSTTKSGPANGPQGGADYTDDEKRMQRKYKGKISHAKDLIEKGDRMMKGALGNINHKDYKKGKIIKEIGEKELAELEANNPFPQIEKSGKAGKGKSASSKPEL